MSADRNEIVPVRRIVDTDIDYHDPAIVAEFLANRQFRNAQRYVFCDALWASEYGSGEKEQWDDRWEDEEERWLAGQKSDHTKRAYKASMKELKRFVRDRFGIRHLWMVQPQHITGWIQMLRTEGSYLAIERKPLSERTIGRHLAAGSSFFEHICSCTEIIDGEQMGLFVTASGNPIPNPFRNRTVQRPEVASYSTAHAVPTPAIQWILRHLADKDEKTLADYRDYAFLLTFYRTGYRADSVLRMKWSDFADRTDGSAGVVFAWKGKRGKERNKAFPDNIYDAIVAYLKADGRWVPGHPRHIQPDDHIWRPLRTHGCANFVNVEPDLPENRHISQSTANDILHRRLTDYFEHQLRKDKKMKRGVREEAKRMAKGFHLHCLRHTFATELAAASNDNILLVQEILDHESPETTRLYIERIKNPEDKATALLQKQFGF